MKRYFILIPLLLILIWLSITLKLFAILGLFLDASACILYAIYKIYSSKNIMLSKLVNVLMILSIICLGIIIWQISTIPAPYPILKI